MSWRSLSWILFRRVGGVCPFTHQGSLVHGQELWAGSQKLGVLILILQCCFASTCLSEHICPNGREMTGRVLVQNREKYSANPREEQEVAAERAARSLPVAIHDPPRPTGCHARPPQLHKLYLPEGAPAQQQEMGPCGNRQSPGHSPAMEEELWRVQAASSISCTRSEGWWVWEQPLTPPHPHHKQATWPPASGS